MGLRTTYLGKAEIQDLLGTNSFGMWRLPRQHGDFPGPETDIYYGPFDEKPDGPVWDAHDVYQWAARTPEFQHRGAVLLRPLPGQRQPGRFLGHQDTAHGPATDWHTGIGVIRMLHTDESHAAAAMAADLAEEHNREIVTVCSLYGDLNPVTGPALVAADTAQPRIEYEASWARIVKLTGQPLPWWPDHLRRFEVTCRWQPGSPAVIAEVPATPRENTLRRAAANSTFSQTARAALTNMADDMRNDRVQNVARDIQTYGNHLATPGRLVIAATHDASTHPIQLVQDDDLLRHGWEEITRSTEPNAVEALDIALGRHPKLLPFGHFTHIPVTDHPVLERWTRRLALCDPTAGHATLAEGKTVDAFFTDPLTDMPVVRTKDDDENHAQWLFYVPLSLPAGRGELASIVLHGPVWITTTDGFVHPAPCTPGEHLWWGNAGGEHPLELAHVVNVLLDNLGARITLNNYWDSAPDGLTALFNEDHKRGTELTRAALLHARMTPPKSRR